MLHLSQDELTKLLKCSCCSNEYDTPKILPCGNNICESCVQRAKKSRTPDSVKCSHSTQSHDFSASTTLETNHALVEVLRIFQKKSTAENNATENSHHNYNAPPSTTSSTHTTTPKQSHSKVVQELITNFTKARLVDPNSDEDEHDVPSILATKIKQINNDLNALEINFSYLVDKTLVTKSVGLISRDRILFVDEKIYGKVRSTRMRLLDAECRILNSVEICQQLEIYQTFCIHGQFILLAFEDCRNDFLLKLYDLNLNKLCEKYVKHDLSSILMTNTRIYLISQARSDVFSLSKSSRGVINEYDYTLKKIKSYGQSDKEKKRFFVRGDIISITEEKITVKDKNEMRIVCTNTGKLLHTFTFDGIATSKIYMDPLTENYLAWNGFKKILYIVGQGHVISHNKLRLYEQIVFNEFQLCTSGCFGLISYENNFIFIVWSVCVCVLYVQTRKNVRVWVWVFFAQNSMPRYTRPKFGVLFESWTRVTQKKCVFFVGIAIFVSNIRISNTKVKCKTNLINCITKIDKKCLIFVSLVWNFTSEECLLQKVKFHTSAIRCPANIDGTL